MSTILITGGSGQLGSVFIDCLLDAGYKVLSVDIAKNDKTHPKFQHIIGDVTDEDFVEQLFKEFWPIYGVVNNVGKGIFTDFLNRSAFEFKEILDTNLLSVFIITKHAIKNAIYFGGKLRIVNMGSIYGVVSSDPRIYGESGERTNSEVYSASKAGVINFSKYIASHYGARGIICNTLSPGGIFNNQSNDFIGQYESKTPMKRMGQAHELTEPLLFLLNEKNSYLNGHNLVVDGGFTAW